ncbi:MAG TPA: LptA/OstA family protein [Myxococcota bacterium]|jgi:lipopolysaccharide transport protein LptA|nr:LptA/OstA family protein [Myxococcota bacterium]
MVRRAGSLALALGAMLALAGPALAETESTTHKAAAASSLEVGVAPFEAVAASGSDVPDVASLLADRLGVLGARKVVGPSQLGAQASGEPAAEQIAEWGGRAGVSSIVVGRTTRLGQRLSLDVRLRAVGGGATLGTFVADVPRPEDLSGAVNRLAEQVVASWNASSQGREASSKEGAAAGAAKGAKTGKGLGLEGFNSKAPISIHSKELEAVDLDSGGRKFLFTGNVEVEQDNVRLTSTKLEAYYPPNASQPDRLVATGNVVITQADKRASCDQATFLNTEQRVLCQGNAALQQGDDHAEGKEIELLLDSQRMFIRGGAQVRITPKPDAEKPAATKATPTAAAEAP